MPAEGGDQLVFFFPLNETFALDLMNGETGPLSPAAVIEASRTVAMTISTFKQRMRAGR